ncbi:fibronectin type III domain-containing protein [Pseudokineococcus marinus]|uniref:Fibronectin type-III domain-containing protein n=1 Tax=Pseudokineococcus marinus TaxID=351215 RepID=A0A849BLW8_9ACTN|nr:fibronectin type III domain-containing protein [Pseudokineococcus marinus]NNH21634.1 hypothetical protein [Pseudokineococcus marinus]
MPTLPDGSTGWTIPPGVALSADGATTARGATGVLRPEAGSTAVLPMFDPVSREPLAQVATSAALGTFPAVLTTAATAVWDFGSVQLPTVSVEATRAGVDALATVTEMAAALARLEASLGGYVTDDELAEALQGFSGGGGGVSASAFSAELLQRGTGSSWREGIGAGTSNVKVGTAATDALRGDYQPTVDDIKDARSGGKRVLRLDTLTDIVRELGLQGLPAASDFFRELVDAVDAAALRGDIGAAAVTETDRLATVDATAALAVAELRASVQQLRDQVAALQQSKSDTQSPLVAFTFPASGASVAGTLTLRGTTSDDVVVTSVRVFAGTIDLGLATLTGTGADLEWSLPAWSTTSVQNGPITLRALATDGSGNTGSTELTVSVANQVVGTNPAPPSGCRWWIPFASKPHARATYETDVVGGATGTGGRFQVAWVSSMPDSRLPSTLLEVDVPVLTQTAYEAWVEEVGGDGGTAGRVVVTSGVAQGAAESWTAPSTAAPVAGRRYRGVVRVQASDGQWSLTHSTRFVAPTGRVLFLEDFGAVGDGVAVDGTDFVAGVGTGPLREALRACNPGDVVRSKKPGTVVTAVTASGTSLTAAAGSFPSSMVGKKVMVHRAGRTDGPLAAGNAGAADPLDNWVHRTTITAVSSDGRTATLAKAVTTAVTGTTAVVGYPTYLVNHMDLDGGLGGTNAGRGGFTLDGAGCLFTSNRYDTAGTRITLPDVTYRDVHQLWAPTGADPKYPARPGTRGDGKNGDSGQWFIEGAGAVGIRLLRCYAERGRDAGFLVYNGPSDWHIVDVVADHTNADGTHVTASAHDGYFVRKTSVYCGDDDGIIGYRSNGDANRPYNIYFDAPVTIGQDWGRGLAFGGTHHCLVTDMLVDGGAQANILVGSDGDMANTSDVQLRRFTFLRSRYRLGLRPYYSQGGSTSSLIQDGMWLKMIASNVTGGKKQSNVLLEKGRVVDGAFIQMVQYGSSAMDDGTVVLRDVVMDGKVNAGLSWRDEGTYPQHLDWRGVRPVGATAITSAPTGPNATPPGSRSVMGVSVTDGTIGATTPAGGGSTTPAPVDSTPPTAPTGVVATRTSDTEGRVTWQASTDAGTGVRGYRVTRVSLASGSSVTVETTTTSATLPNLSATSSYRVTVVAFDAVPNVSDPSAAATLGTYTAPTTATAAPAAPTGLTGQRTSTTTATVSWTAPTGQPVTGYDVRRVVQGQDIGAVTPRRVTGTSLDDTGLGSGNGYFYDVRAVNNVGPGPYAPGVAVNLYDPR